MTIQQIIDNRVSSITYSLALVPYLIDSKKGDIKFLIWLKEKFPKEYEEALWKVFRGEMKFPKDVTRRSLEKPRRNSHYWDYGPRS